MKVKAFVLTLSLISSILFGGILASATCTWQFGYTFNTAYSNYHHSSKSHSATVINNNTGRQGTDTQGPGVWAKAVVGRNLIEKATFYYNHW